MSMNISVSANQLDINEKDEITVHILDVKLLKNCCYIVVVSFTDGWN